MTVRDLDDSMRYLVVWMRIIGIDIKMESSFNERRKVKIWPIILFLVGFTVSIWSLFAVSLEQNIR